MGRKSIPGRRNCRCKGPEAGVPTAEPPHSKASGPGQGARGGLGEGARSQALDLAGHEDRGFYALEAPEHCPRGGRGDSEAVRSCCSDADRRRGS